MKKEEGRVGEKRGMKEKERRNRIEKETKGKGVKEKGQKDE